MPPSILFIVRKRFNLILLLLTLVLFFIFTIL